MEIFASTYRLQFHEGFTFQDLLPLLPYLDELGISTIYAAPIFSATPGSQHGYDVTDPHTINPAIGSRHQLNELYRALEQRDMHWLQDIVPNHMAFTPHNLRLMDVLERGPHSPFYNYFDIDWNHPSAALHGRLMTPFLGQPLDTCLDQQEITLHFSAEGFTINYYDAHYPLSVPAYQMLLELIAATEITRFHLEEFIAQARVLKDFDAWQTYKKNWITQLCHNQAYLHGLQNIAAAMNQDKTLLKNLLAQQYYALSYWKDTEREINYRRFFTINGLICLRMEDPAVFNEYHTLLHTLYKEHIIQGLRIDHIDGLQNPTEYIERLRALFGDDCYIIAEKILEEHETLPSSWPIQGTSGYQFLSQVNQLFTNRAGAEKLLTLYHALVPENKSYEEVVATNKKLILTQYMGGEWDNLTRYFFTLKLQDQHSRHRIKEALGLMMRSMPVYRIYPRQIPLANENLAFMELTFRDALALDGDFHDELTYLYNLFTTPPKDPDHHHRILHFLHRCMQFTGPLTAKGIEDTTFYMYNPLLAHVEVGDSPATLGISIQAFHERMIARRRLVPLALNTTATHDTKRGEDARLRLSTLSEIPELWETAVEKWLCLHKDLRARIHGNPAPTRNDEYFIYQTIIAHFPHDLTVDADWMERLQEYIRKALREAKVNSSWEAPDTAYEEACHDFLNTLLTPNSDFLKDALPLIQKVTRAANHYSLGQTLLKITAPGIPDTYQGCELWDLSFVDPDNRRPVDYGKRASMLQQLTEAALQGQDALRACLHTHRHEGIEKLFVTWKTLNFRKSHNALFAQGDYLPLPVEGDTALTAVAYARTFHQQWVIIIAPLNLLETGDQPVDWHTHRIKLPPQAPGQWKNIFTGQRFTTKKHLHLADVFEQFSPALLVGG